MDVACRLDELEEQHKVPIKFDQFCSPPLCVLRAHPEASLWPPPELSNSSPVRRQKGATSPQSQQITTTTIKVNNIESYLLIVCVFLFITADVEAANCREAKLDEKAKGEASEGPDNQMRRISFGCRPRTVFGWQITAKAKELSSSRTARNFILF